MASNHRVWFVSLVCATLFSVPGRAEEFITMLPPANYEPVRVGAARTLSVFEPAQGGARRVVSRAAEQPFRFYFQRSKDASGRRLDQVVVTKTYAPGATGESLTGIKEGIYTIPASGKLKIGRRPQLHRDGSYSRTSWTLFLSADKKGLSITSKHWTRYPGQGTVRRSGLRRFELHAADNNQPRAMRQQRIERLLRPRPR